MKKLLAYYKHEDGFVAVMAAFLMVIILGFSAFAIDIGMNDYKRSQMQTTLDAAALAAVYKLPDETQARATALSYITKNGFTTDGITVTFESSDQVIRIDSTKRINTYFANIFGIPSTHYANYAKATVGVKSAGGVFDYLIFQGATTGTLTMGGTFNVYGSVHSNGNFSASPGHGYIMGAAEAHLTSWINIWTCTAGSVVSGVPIVPMADFTSCVSQVMPTTWTDIPLSDLNNPTSRIIKTGNFRVAAGNVSIRNGFTLTGNLYVNGNLTISGGSPVCIQNGGLIYATGTINFGNTYQGDGCVFAGGSITFTGSNNTVTQNKPIAIYSQTGSVTLTPASTTVYGIVYAPLGDVNVGGGATTFHGSLIGNTVSGIPANLTMYSNEIGLPFTIGSRTGILIN